MSRVATAISKAYGTTPKSRAALAIERAYGSATPNVAAATPGVARLPASLRGTHSEGADPFAMPSTALGGLSSQYASPQFAQDMQARRTAGMPEYMGVPGAAPPIVGQQAVSDQSIVGSALASFRGGVGEPADAVPLAKLALGGTVTDPRIFSQIAQSERSRMATPISRGAERLGQAGSVVEALGQVITNPQGQIDLAARSLGSQIGSYLAAPALGPAAPLGIGMNSAAVEFANELRSLAAQANFNLQDERDIARLVSSPLFEGMVAQAKVKAGIVGGSDMLTAGIASKIPVVGTVGQRAARLGAGTAIGSAGGAGGEALSQYAARGEVDDPVAVVQEAVAELPGSLVEAAQLTRGRNANRQNNQGGQDQAVSRAGGPVPTGGPNLPAGDNLGRPGDAAQPAAGQPATDAVDEENLADAELTDEEAMRLLDDEEAAPTTDAAGIPIPRGASGFQGVTNEGAFVPPEVRKQTASSQVQAAATTPIPAASDSGDSVPSLASVQQTSPDDSLAPRRTTGPGSIPLESQAASTGELGAALAEVAQSDAVQGAASVNPLGDEESDATFLRGLDRNAAAAGVQSPQTASSPRTDAGQSLAQTSSQQPVTLAESSPNSILPLLSQRAGKPVMVADEKRLTGTERKIRDRAAKGFSRQVVYVDTDSDVEGAILGSTPTTIYVRRGLGAMRLAPVVAHEMGHSIRRTNGELAREVEERIGRDRLLELGREQFAQQSDSSVGVDGDPNEDALLDEGFARLIEKAVEGDADLATRLVEDPGLWQRIKTWVRDSLAKAGIARGDGEAVAIARALDRVESEVKKATELRKLFKHNVRDSFWELSDAEKRRAYLNADEKLMFANRNDLTKAQQIRRDAILRQRAYEKRMGTADTPMMFSAKNRGVNKPVPTININGVDRATVASDGSPLASDDAGVREFWAWFGNSAAVDDRGRPLVLYHGSPSPERITEFRAGKDGIYFTDDAKTAGEYTARRGMWRGPKTGVVTDAFVSMKNPLVIDAAGKRNDNIPVPWQPWKPKVFGNLPAGAVSVSKAAEWAKANNHDGMIVRNVIDAADVTDTRKSNVFVAFDPTQIRSGDPSAAVRFSARQLNLNAQDQADARTVGKLSQQAAEASQNADAEKTRRKAEVGGVKAQRDLERRAGQIVEREMIRQERRYQKLVEKKAAEALSLEQKRQMARAEIARLKRLFKDAVASKDRWASIYQQAVAREDARAAERDEARATIADMKTLASDKDRALRLLRDAMMNALPVSERGSLATKIAAVKTAGDGFRLLLEVERLSHVSDAKTLGRKMKALTGVSDVRDLADPVKRDRVVNRGDLKILSGLERDAASGGGNAKDEARKAIQDFLNAGARLDREIDAKADAATLQATVAEMQYAFQTLAQIVQTQKLEDKIIKAGRLSMLADVVQQSLGSITRAPALLIARAGKRAPAIKGAAMKFFLDLPTKIRIIEGGNRGALYQGIVEPLEKAISASFGLRESTYRKADDIARRAGYADLKDMMVKVSGILGEASQKTIALSEEVGGTKEITLGQAMKVYAMDPETLEQALRGKRALHWEGNLAGDGFLLTPEAYTEIVGKIDAKHRDAVDSLKDLRDTLFPGMARVVKILTGVEPPKVFGYDPNRINPLWLSRNLKEQAASLSPINMITTSLENLGITKARESKSAPLVMTDFMQDWTQSIDQVSRITGMAEAVRNSKVILSDPAMVKAIGDRYGDKMLMHLNKTIDAAAGIQTPDKLPGVTRFLQALARNLGKSWTSLNVMSWLRNLGGLSTLAPSMPRMIYIRGIRDAFKPGLWKEAVESSPMIRQHFASGPAGLIGLADGLESASSRESAMRDAKAAARSVASAAKNAWALQPLDSLRDVRDVLAKSVPSVTDHIRILNWFASIPARVAYAGMKAQYGKDTAKVVRETEKVLRATQGMGDSLMRAGWQNAVMGTPLGSYAMFSNDSTRQLSMLVNAAMDGKKSFAKTAAAVGLNAAWGGLVVGALGKAGLSALIGGGDDEDEDKAIRDGLWTGGRDLAGVVPGLDRLVELARAAVEWRPGGPGEAALGSPVTGGLTSIVDSGAGLGLATFALIDGKEGAEERFWKNLERAILGTTDALGVPVGSAVRQTKRVVEATQ